MVASWGWSTGDVPPAEGTGVTVTGPESVGIQSKVWFESEVGETGTGSSVGGSWSQGSGSTGAIVLGPDSVKTPSGVSSETGRAAWLIGGLETPRGTVGMGMEDDGRLTAMAGVGVLRWVVTEGASNSKVAGIAG